MTIYEERDYEEYITKGEHFLAMAEFFYEGKKLKLAIRKFYHAEICFEKAHEIASRCLDVQLVLTAKEKEYYCLEKIDELEQFRNVSLDEFIR